MATDDERREAARKLREIELMKLPDSDSEMEAIHEAVGCWFGQPHFDQEVTDRLADLIEPSGHECVPGECPMNVRRDNDRIDQERLLAIADGVQALCNLAHAAGEDDLGRPWGDENSIWMREQQRLERRK